MLLALLIGCPGTMDTSDTDPDTGDTVVDTQPQLDPDLGFALSGWEGATLALVRIEIGEDLNAEDVWQAWVPDADVLEVEAGTPPEDHFVAADPEDMPGFEVALYLPVLFTDSNGDGMLDQGEPVIGVSPHWAVNARGTLPDSIPGLIEGWNGYIPAFDDGDGQASDPLTIPVSDNVKPVEEIELSGTGDTAENLRLMLTPISLITEGTGEAMWDQPLAGTFTTSLVGAPPQEHLDTYEGLGEAALELYISYIDNDASGSFTPGDGPLHTGCFDGRAVFVVWREPAELSLTEAWMAALQGMQSGWSAMLLNGEGEGPTVLDPSNYGDIQIDDSCSLGDD
jgi:hypothetical protein